MSNILWGLWDDGIVITSTEEDFKLYRMTDSYEDWVGLAMYDIGFEELSESEWEPFRKDAIIRLQADTRFTYSKEFETWLEKFQ